MPRVLKTVLIILAAGLSAGLAPAHARAAHTLSADGFSAEIDPATLHVVCTIEQEGRSAVVSRPQPGLPEPTGIEASGDTLAWTMQDVRILARVVDHGLTLTFTSESRCTIVFPMLGRDPSNDPDLREWVLPIHEGHLIPDDDADWAEHLAQQSPTNTLEGLSVPFLGLREADGHTLTWVLQDPVNNTLRYTGDGAAQPIGLSITHAFNPVMDDTRYRVRFVFTGDNPIAPALAYRAYLFEHGLLRTLADKIEANPRVDRLRGALHAYVWDDGLISAHDLRQAKPIAALLHNAAEQDRGDSGPARLWSLLDEAGRDAVEQLVAEDWPSMYLKRELASALSRVMAGEDGEAMSPGEVYAVLQDHVQPTDTWGDGISIGMVDALQEAGIERAVLLASDLGPSASKPHVSAYADTVGYLFGPYDSYHSIHPPSMPADQTWETAQFDQALWELGGIQHEDGSYSAGFKQRGRHLSPIAARPYVEARVAGLLERAPHTAWFVDCDAFGQLFDDYTPGRMCSKFDDMRERLSRMRWMSDAHGLVVGSEGGSAYAADAVHYAHGMMTPVIGWGDPRLTERDSTYYLGGWWPTNGPAVFVKQVPLAPGYEKVHYDPRYRVPLYQAALHDCVVATHHWGYHSFKFSDQVQTVALTEQLYNVPPLVHLNLEQWALHGQAISERMHFFAPIHRAGSLLPMTSFRWLDEKRLVQQTTLGERYTITVNFGESPFDLEGESIPPRTAVCHDRDTGEVTRYTP